MKDSYAFYKDKLSGEYKEVFAKTEMYVLSQNVDDDTTEERLGELLDVFLSAEESGKPVEKIVGNDLESFCRSVCSDFSLKNRLLNFADYFKVIAWVLVISLFTDLICNINSLLHGEALDLWSERGDFLLGYLASIFASWAIMTAVNTLTCRLMFRSKSFSAKKLTAIGVTATLSTFLIVYVVLINLNISIRFYCPYWVIPTCAAGYLLFYYFAIKKGSKRRKIKFTDLVSEEMRKDFPEEMEKSLKRRDVKALKGERASFRLRNFLIKRKRNAASPKS